MNNMPGSLKYTIRCGCKNPHAITPAQVAYAKRALQVAYSTRDRTAIAKIKDALNGCIGLSATEREDAKDEFSRMAALTLIKAHERNIKC